MVRLLPARRWLLSQRDLREVLADEVEFRIDVSPTKRPVRVGAIIVLVALVRSFEAPERQDEGVDGLAGLTREMRAGAIEAAA